MNTTGEQEVQTEASTANELPALTDDQVRAIAEGIDGLQAKLAEDTALQLEIENVIREHLRTAVNAQTVEKIYAGLELYLDADSASFLLDILNDSPFLEQVKSHSSAQLWSWLRRMLALYAYDFRKAYQIFSESPNAWDILNRHTYYDALIDMWIISLEIVKYNGERLALEESPASALGLVNGIVDTLTSMPPDIAPKLIDKGYLAETATRFLSLIELYAPGLLTEMAEAEDMEAVQPAP